MIRDNIMTYISSSYFMSNVECYNNTDDMLDDLLQRKITDESFHDMRSEELEKDWHGVASYEEALDLLLNGYEPHMERLKKEILIDAPRRINGTNRRRHCANDVVGFQPIVPLAIQGVPNAMVNILEVHDDARILDIYYDLSCSHIISSEKIIAAGLQLLRFIYDLELSSHRINLYVIQCYSGEASADILCIKLKNCNTPLDLKRISFPLTHAAFMRVIGFDWYSKFPPGIYREKYGSTITSCIGLENTQRLFRALFGPAACYTCASELILHGESHLYDAIRIRNYGENSR